MATAIVTSASTPRPPRPRRFVWLLLICLIAGTSAGTWWELRRNAAGDGASPQVRWVTPEIRSVSTLVNATGTVRLKTGAEVRVGAQISGIVKRLNVRVGAHVQQGETIAEIDARPILAKVDQARALLAQAEVSLIKSTTDFSRVQKLFESGLVPEQQFSDARAALDAAKAGVAAAQSGLAAARVDLDYVEIRAPISGTVASITTQQGETVATSFAAPTFVTIIQESAMEVIAMVDEADIGNIRRGQQTTFTAETYPDKEFQGRVTRIAPIATVISGVVNYEVAISIQRDLQLLKPDMTTNVNIRTAEHQALLIPAQCVHKENSQSFVYMARGAEPPARREVSVGARIGNQVEVIRGLASNDKVRLEIGGAAK